MPIVTPRALLRKNAITPGARACITDATLDDIREAFQYLEITESTQSKHYTPLFVNTLGASFSQLPQAVQFLHSQVDRATFYGTASVTCGVNLLSRIIAALFSFPKAGTAIPVRVDMTCSEDREYWHRTFDGKSFCSVLTSSRPGHVKERFGPLTFEMQLTIVERSITMPMCKGWFLGVPMPRFLLPESEAREYEEDGLFHFDVALSTPLCGLLTRYTGCLVKDK